MFFAAPFIVSSGENSGENQLRKSFPPAFHIKRLFVLYHKLTPFSSIQQLSNSRFLHNSQGLPDFLSATHGQLSKTENGKMQDLKCNPAKAVFHGCRSPGKAPEAAKKLDKDLLNGV